EQRGHLVVVPVVELDGYPTVTGIDDGAPGQVHPPARGQ
ncbi:MAG: hypothetical protein JWR78_2943, partial [Mycobacterium sp.]|nr:hypothetical protein [Mycobacterium sp.]